MVGLDWNDTEESGFKLLGVGGTLVDTWGLGLMDLAGYCLMLMNESPDNKG